MMNKDIIKKDCCSSPICSEKKVKDGLLEKYGVTNAAYIEEKKKKIKHSCIKKYGVDNAFKADSIKKKIVQTNLKKYGVPYCTQNKEVKNKAVQTNFKKYGVSHYTKTDEYRQRFSKENSPCWKGGVASSRVERATIEYRDWRKSVFTKDHYTCVCCGSRNKHGGKNIELHAHHICNWNDNKDLRYITENGVTLCSSCHYKFHSIYGKKNNTKKQLEDFLRQKDMLNLQEKELQEQSDKKLAG